LGYEVIAMQPKASLSFSELSEVEGMATDLQLSSYLSTQASLHINLVG
jgi:hypothetical protein